MNQPEISKIVKFIENPKSFKENSPGVLWIWGEDDNAGHTSWAIILGKALLSNSLNKVKFVSMQNLVNAFTDFDDKKAFFNELEKNNIFIIDDAFDENRFYIKGDYVKINLYNWLNNILNDEKNLICTSNKSILKIDSTYSQCKSVLLRNYQEIEIKGPQSLKS